MEIDHPILGKYEVIQKIGEGSFASVYLARHSVLHYPVAIKIFQDNKNDEIIHKSIIHPFICQDFDLIKTFAGNNCIIMEYVNGETLLDFVNNCNFLSESTIRNIFGQLVIAIDYLHQNHIIHRDLKCENIMIDKNQNIRLIDLNFSCQNEISHSTICGSPNYISPEMLNNGHYNDSIDIWSLGIIIYAITFGYLPFENPNISNVLYLITYTEPNFPEDHEVNSDLIDLIKKMLIKNPEQRITIDQIKNHPFFTSDSKKNNFIFDDQKINGIVHDPYTKKAEDTNIFQKMNLTLKETISAASEIKNNQMTYNSMTYSVLYKLFVSNEQMNCYSHCFLLPIKKMRMKISSNELLPFLLVNNPLLQNRLNNSKSHLQIDDINKNEEKKNNTETKKIVFRKIAGNKLKFRRFKSQTKTGSPINILDSKKGSFSSQFKKIKSKI